MTECTFNALAFLLRLQTTWQVVSFENLPNSCGKLDCKKTRASYASIEKQTNRQTLQKNWNLVVDKNPIVFFC